MHTAHMMRPKKTLKLDRQKLLTFPLFHGLDSAVMTSLLTGAHAELVEVRHVVADNGAPVPAVLVVLAGRVELAAVNHGGGRVVFGPLGPGAVIGDAALLDHTAFALEARTFAVTATALEDCVILSIAASAFLRTIARDLQFAGNVARVLARRLRMMVVRDTWITTLDVPVRLARFLTWMADTEGIRAPSDMTTGPRQLTLRMSQERLGQVIGTTRETINKHLRRWAKQGVLEHIGGRIRILDLTRLRAFAEVSLEVLELASVAKALGLRSDR